MVALTDFPGDPHIGADLLRRWSEPHRRYHTLDHLRAMLTVIDEHADLASDPDAVRLAAWFHDAIYEPFAPDNETASAELAVSLGMGPEVERLVLLTAGHKVADGDRNGALLADADLAVLAASPSVYARYAASVREEYAAVPDEVFRPGRARILAALLELPSLYRIVPARAEWTTRAHHNLRTEITTLSGAP